MYENEITVISQTSSYAISRHKCLAPIDPATEKRPLRSSVQKGNLDFLLLPVYKTYRLVSLSICLVSDAVW